jgi:hypothetical protein
LQRTPVDADVVIEVCRDFDLLQDIDAPSRAAVRLAPPSSRSGSSGSNAPPVPASSSGTGAGSGTPPAGAKMAAPPEGLELRPVHPIRTDDRLKIFDRPAEGRRLEPPADRGGVEPGKRKRFLFF